MIQLELYIKEIVRFLRTMTIKNDYFKQQMEDTCVADAFIGKLPDNLHPYYRRLLGKCSYESFNEFRQLAGIPDTVSDAQLAVDYGFDYVAVSATADQVTNTIIEGFSIKLRSDLVDINGSTYRVYPNCVWYYGQICPVRLLYKKYDELMVINSIDTHTVIPFNRHMLNSKTHQKTASLYRMPSRYYTKICTKYPLMTDVVKAIVYPVPSLEACVNASNYSLISCDLTQLRENERSTMYTCVLDVLSMIKRRWDVKEFVYEDLYALSVQAKIWDTLLLALMKQRVVNIRTSAAHKYHVWEYLKSHGLDDYSDVLSTKQALFLYRNLPYLLRNRGSDFNLILLSHKLLSDWNIEIVGKNILQTTPEFKDTCKSTPVVDSVVVGESVLNKLKSIDANDLSYLNKTKKFEDELNTFDYRKSDLQQMQSGTIESMSSLYEKEKESGLEYQEKTLYDISTADQTRQFTYTPHTSTVTKLLEISKTTVSTLFKQIYARFMTESLLYRASIGQADYMISFIPDGMSYSVNLHVKDAIGLVWYCALKETGWYTGDGKPDPDIYLTVPYKESFEPISGVYDWNNHRYNTKCNNCNTGHIEEIFNIVPTSFILKSDTLPAEFSGVYNLVDRSLPINKWEWTHESGAVTFGYNTSGSERFWFIKSATHTLSADHRYPYNGWKKKEFEWRLGSSTFKSTMTVNSFTYMIDDLMPNYNTGSYEELINLLHEQAVGYIQIYKELHGSDWSKQHTGTLDLIEERTVNKFVKLELFNGETFEEYVASNANIKEIIDRIESNTTSVIQAEYAKLGNSIVKSLFPLDTEYLEDNAGVSMMRYNRLKELFINLCSYNVAFIDGSVGETETTCTLTNFITQDYDYNETTIGVTEYINPETMDIKHRHRFTTHVCDIDIESAVVVEPPVSSYDINISKDSFYVKTLYPMCVNCKLTKETCNVYDTPVDRCASQISCEGCILRTGQAINCVGSDTTSYIPFYVKTEEGTEEEVVPSIDLTNPVRILQTATKSTRKRKKKS